MSSEGSPVQPRGRLDRRWLAAAAAALVLIIGGVWLATQRSSSSDDTSGSAAAPSASAAGATTGSGSSAEPGSAESEGAGATEGPDGSTPSGTDATTGPSAEATEEFPVPVDDEQDVGQTSSVAKDITIGVPTIIAAEAGGSGGIGDLAGPAVVVEVAVVNGSDKKVSLDDVEVTTTVGSLPASPVVTDARNDPLTGSLRAGRTATGMYVFHLPGTTSKDVTVLVAVPGRSTVAFHGELG